MVKIRYTELVASAESLGQLNEVMAVDRGRFYALYYKEFYSEGPKEGDSSFIAKIASMNSPIKKQPFADKIIQGGKKLFKRVHGVRKNCVVGNNKVDFVVPYTLAKLESVEILWCPKGCYADLNVYDNALGTISGTPNLKLNQFGYSTNIRQEYHIQKSQYDADVIQGMKIELSIDLPSAVEVGLNIELNQVV